ncbi:hypothetical protein V8E54_005350 [Elaphomyces granulatus]
MFEQNAARRPECGNKTSYYIIEPPLHDSAADLHSRAGQSDFAPIETYDLGRMDVACPQCGALHWLGEQLSTSSAAAPHFNMCYTGVSVPRRSRASGTRAVLGR